LYETIYQGDKLSITNFNVLSNNKLCYVNCSDLDCLINILSKINQAYVLNKLQIPFISIAAKHGNVCGIGIDYHSKKISLTKALWGNPQAIWGGELIINFKINLDIANDICASEERLKKFKSEKWMLDLVVSPEITEDSLEKIKLRKNTKILVNKHLYKSYLPKKSQKIYKFLRNAIIEQTSPNFIIKFNELEVISKKRILPRKNLDNLIISWAASYSSFHGGNEVALAKNNMLLNCAGGPSTIEAAETAINRAKKIHKKIGNSVFCADAFLPFIDVLQILKSNNIFIGVMPSGGIRLKEIKKYMKKENMNIGLIQEKFRGFYRH
jgi:phosphoribosylaminoimidazolecarboxamide formyltransferase/IMP cyclohydrolase